MVPRVSGLEGSHCKPMGYLPYTSSEQVGGLIIHTELIYEYTIYRRPIPIQALGAEEGGGLITHHGLIIHTIRYRQHHAIMGYVARPLHSACGQCSCSLASCHFIVVSSFASSVHLPTALMLVRENVT